MGFLDKIFGKNKLLEQPVIIEKKKYESDWDFYLTNINDIVGSIAVDLGLNSVAPIKEQSNLVWISVKMNSPREDGLSSSEEFKLLGEIEDALVNAIKAKYVSTNVGRVTSNGIRIFYFYLENNLLYDKTISETMVAFPTYNYDYSTSEEQEWDCYFQFLYPEPEQLQSITNRKVLNNLKKSGDNLVKAREVNHWIFFKNPADRESFVDKIKEQNFTITNKDYDQAFGKFPFRLRINRVDKVDQESVDEYVIYLWNLANECDGDYDGWETSVEID